MRARELLASFSQERIFGGAIVLASLQFGASVAGLIRDRVLAQTFPGLGVVDAYISSFRLSDLLFQMCIMAGFSVGFVPLLARYKAENNQQGMYDLLNGILGIAGLTFGIIALLASVLFPWIAPYLVQFEPETMQLYIRFGQLALLTNFLFVFGNAFGQYLIAVQRYWMYGLTPIVYTVGTILGTLYLTPQYGEMGPMYGTLIGAIVYVIIRFIAVFSGGYRLHLKFWHPDMAHFLKMMLPRMLALGALQLQLLLFDTIASGLDAGSVTINAYARNFQSVAVGVAGIALAQSAFSLLSQAAAKKEQQRFWIYLRKGVLLLLVLTIPGAIALVLLAPVAAMLVQLTHVLPVFSFCLLLYAISIPFESLNHLFYRAFYAMKNSVIPSTFSVINGIVAITVSAVFASTYGVYALAIGFTAGQILQLLGMSLLLPRTVRTIHSGRKDS